MSGIVTDIKELTAKKVLVYIDYKEAFAVYKGELRKFNISVQRIIDDSTYDELIKVLSKRAVIRAMSLLKNKDYTRAELINKLKKDYYPDNCIDAAISYVEKYGYIDDYRYSFNYITFKSSSKSRKMIKSFLKSKEIDDSIIEKAFSDFFGGDDIDNYEYDIVLKQMKKKIQKYDDKNLDYKEKQKIIAYFYRKGFQVDIIKKVLDVVVNY